MLFLAKNSRGDSMVLFNTALKMDILLAMKVLEKKRTPL